MNFLEKRKEKENYTRKLHIPNFTMKISRCGYMNIKESMFHLIVWDGLVDMLLLNRLYEILSNDGYCPLNQNGFKGLIYGGTLNYSN